MQHVIVLKLASGDHIAMGPFDTKEQAERIASVQDQFLVPTPALVVPLYDPEDEPDEDDG